MSRSENLLRSERDGVYGLRVQGLSRLEHLCVQSHSSWPQLHVTMKRGSIAAFADKVSEARATFRLLGAGAEVERASGRASFTFEAEPHPEAVVHPYLAPVAALMSYWHGREGLHGGAFLVDDGAWGVLGDRESGKSSTLARLALDGVAVVTDDLLVVGRRTAFAGPRAIDLRADAAHALGVGEPLGVVGTRERWRMRLESTTGQVPHRGWVFLAWGEKRVVTRIPAGELLQRLAAERSIRLPPRRPAALLELAGLPGFELRRPRDWSSLEETTNLLLDSLP